MIISNNEMKDIIKTVNYLEDSGWLIKGFTEIIGKKQKNKGVDVIT